MTNREAKPARLRTRSIWPVDARLLGKKILRSEGFQRVAAAGLSGLLSLIYQSNRDTGSSSDSRTLLEGHWPVIFALWHGQHLLIPYAAPRDRRFVSLVSRSIDAEVNARVIMRAGHEVIRGSGGRERGSANRKGGIKAMISMRDALRAGTNVVMIADISKGEARQAGVGVVRLARLSGRPIVPMALATSRFHVIAKSWDRTTINLPFGKRCLRLGEPIYVPAEADEDMVAAARIRVTEELDRVTREAYAAVGVAS